MSAPFALPGVETRFVSLDGLSVAYLTAGPDDHEGDSDPPIVLLHGGGLDRAALSWKFTIPALTTDRRVYAPDWPGFGESDPPDLPDEEISTDYFLTVLDRFLDALDLVDVTLCGISMGGGVALGYALSNPERVSRVALLDSYGLGGAVPGGRLAHLFVQSSLPSDLVTALLRRSRRLTALSVRGIVAPGNLTDDLIDEVYEIVTRPKSTDTWGAFQRNEVGPTGLRTNYVDQLPDLSVPTLVLHGERDSLVPAEWAVRAGPSIPDREIRILPDCGHWPPRERPETTNEHLRAFLIES